MKVLKCVYLGIFLLLAVSAFADEPNIQLDINPDTIGLNEQATVSVAVDQKIDQIVPTESQDYDMSYAGESQSFQMTTINGKTTQSHQYSYNFIVVPKKKGNLSIGPFTIKIKNNVYHTSAKIIKVVRSGQNSGRSGNDPFAQFRDLFGSSKRIPELYFKLVPHASSARKNQQIILDGYIISSDKSALDYQFTEVSPVRSDKCALIDISQTLDGQITRNGSYYQKIVKRYVLFPIESGRLGIAPPNIISVTPYGQIQLRSEVIAIDSFSIQSQEGIAYVGDISIKADISTNETDIGKNINLTLDMTGNGNLKSLSNPYGDFTNDSLIISAPLNQLKLLEYRNGKAFFKQSVKYTIIPRRSGKIRIPEVVINYYDNGINPRKFVIRSFDIQVSELKSLSESAMYRIKSIDNPKRFDILLFHPLALLLVIISLILPCLAFLYGNHLDKMSTDKGYARKFMADKRLLKYLSEAKKLLQNKNYKDFYSALEKGIFYYITDKLSIPAGIGYKELVGLMVEHKIQDSLIESFKDIYKECSQYAYSPAGGENEAEKLLEKAIGLIEQLK